MTKLVIPRWFIRHQCVRTGTRLPKWKAFEPPIANYGFHAGRNATMHSILHPQNIPPNSGPVYDVDIKRPIDTVSGDKFDPADFQFYAVGMNVYNVAQKCTCRSCGGVIISAHLRRKHSEVLGCYDKLIKAYKLLDLDQKCVICDTRTIGRRWGVPLCSKGCVKEWCFHIVRPASVSAALDLVITQG